MLVALSIMALVLGPFLVFFNVWLPLLADEGGSAFGAGERAVQWVLACCGPAAGLTALVGSIRYVRGKDGARLAIFGLVACPTAFVLWTAVFFF